MGPFQKIDRAGPIWPPEELAGELPNVPHAVVPADVGAVDAAGGGPGLDLPGDDAVHREDDPLASFLQDLPGQLEALLLHQRRSHLEPERPEEGVRHRASQEQAVDSREEGAQDFGFPRDLRPAENTEEGTLRTR